MNLFLDGASCYATAQLAGKYTTVDSTARVFTVAPGQGRTDGAIKCVSTSNDVNTPGYLEFGPLYTQAGVWSQQAEGSWGAAIKFQDIARNTGGGFGAGLVVNGGLFSTWNGGSTNFSLGVNANGTVTAYRPGFLGGVAQLGTSLTAFQSNQWTYFEVEFKLSQGNDGYIRIWANGNRVLNFVGRTSPNGGDVFPFTPPAALFNTVRVLGGSSQVAPFLTQWMCDEYLNDANAPNASRFGDISIAFIKPDGVGALTEWSPTGAADNYACVNDVPPGGSTYVEALTAGLRDTYTFENVVGDPVAIQVCQYGKKLTASGASLAAITRQGGVNYDGPTQGIGSTNLRYYLQPYDTNPATGQAYTEAEMNAGEWGPLKVS